MTIRITKDKINIREKLSELDKPSGLVGNEILRSDTSADARNALDLEEHLFEDFESTGIDDNATSTMVTVSDSGLLLDGEIVIANFQKLKLGGYHAGGATLGYTGNGNLTINPRSGYSSVFETGKVGIGTSSPSQKLTVTGNAYVGTGNYFTDNTSGYFFSGNGSYDAGVFATGTSLTTLKAQNNIAFTTASSEKMRIDSSGKVGIGTSSPVEKLYVNSTSGDARIGLNAPTGSDTEIKFSNNGTVEYSIGHDDATDNFVIGTTNVDSGLVSVTKSGNVGINTASPSVPLQVQGDGNTFRLDGTANTGRGILIRNAGTSTAYLKTDGNLDINCEDAGRHIAFKTADSERMRIDSAGNVGIGTSSPSSRLEVATSENVNGYSDGAVQVVSNSPIAFVAPSNLNPSLNRWGFKLRETTDGDFSIHDYRQGTTRLLIDGTGKVGIGTNDPDTALHVRTSGTAFKIEDSTSGVIQLGQWDGVTNRIEASGGNKDLYLINYGTGSMRFATGASEKARIDSNGNLLVGTTAEYGSSGITLNPTGMVYARRLNNVPVYARRDGNDGDLVHIEKAGTKVGSIGTFGSTTFIQSAGAANYSGLLFNSGGGTGYIEPTLATGASAADPRRDGSVSMGSSSYRFKDLYLSGKVSNPSGDLSISCEHASSDLLLGTERSVRFFNSGSEKARIDSSGNLLIGTTGSNHGQIVVHPSSASRAATHLISPTSQPALGTRPQVLEGIVYLDTVSLGDTITLPFTSQGNFNTRHLVELRWYSEEYNQSGPGQAGRALISVRSLGSLGTSVLESSGNFSSVSSSGTNLNITVNTPFTGGLNNHEGVAIYYKILTSRPDWVQIQNLTLN